MMRFISFFKFYFSPNRIYGLDILRALAIMLVTIFHSGYILHYNNYQQLFLLDGLDGVSLFFVLSGFLIGGVLVRILEKDGVAFKTLLNFWIRRWLRTLPAYFFVLSTLLILSILLTPHFSLRDAYKFYLFLQNFNYRQPKFFPESWSLSIEEWFYLLVPLIIILIIKFFRLSIKTAILATTIAIIVFAVTFRFCRFLNTPTYTLDSWIYMFRNQVTTRLDSLMLGVLGAYCSQYHKSFFSKNKFILLFAGVLILLMQTACDLFHLVGFGLYQCVFSFTVTAIGGVFLLPFLSELRTGSGFIYKIITYISIVSYSLYLLSDYFLRCFMLKYIDYHSLSRFLPASSMFIQYLLYWVYVFIGAHILYKCIEKPFMDFRKNIRI